MASDVTLILLCSRHTRNSVNALVGAVETGPDFDAVEIRLPRNYSELKADLTEVAGRRRAVVGLSLFSLQVAQAADFASRIRREFGPDVLLLAGGPHATADPLGVLRLGFDLVAPNEGEQTLRDLLTALLAGRDWRGVRGLAYLDPAGPAAGLRRTPPQPPIALDDFAPFPLQRRKAGPIEITRGCPFACGYCQTSHLLGARPRHRGVAAVARWVEVMGSRGPADVRVVTPDAFAYGSPDGRSINLPALEELLTAMRQAAGPANRIFFGSFPSEVRPEHVNPATLELVRRYANNDNLIIGAQSGSQRMLDLCRRGHTVADVINAASLTLRAGLKANVDFIFGLPGEADADEQATLELIGELAGMGAAIRGHAFMPLPQTPFATAQPGRVTPRTRAALLDLQRAGKLTGLWWRQERHAARVGQ
jgi:B12-binding domain/radical SAM domain protein